MKHLNNKLENSIIGAISMAIICLADLKVWSALAGSLGFISVVILAGVGLVSGILAVKFAKDIETTKMEIKELKEICSLERVTLSKD